MLDGGSGARARLEALARNYRWTWSAATQQVFARLHAAAPCEAVHPLALVSEALEPALEADPTLANAISEAYAELQRELDDAPERGAIAYFSPEFALSETLPQYSGGLGVLAGDHLKAASDRRLPLAGVGLLYREGFFHQAIDEGGDQTERYEHLDPATTGLVDTGVRVVVEMGRVRPRVAIWRADVGVVPLYLLDTMVPGNSRPTQAITDRLYSGDGQHRLRQELVLGIGGVRALKALGIHPEVFHLNEGHAGFLGLELLHDLIAEGESLESAIEIARDRVVFTTHTPVPAGIDRFPDELLAGYLTHWEESHGVATGSLLDLGRMPGDPPGVFNMAAFCLQLAGRTNGVSRLHGGVSRSLFEGVPGADAIGHVTNGVHARTWVSAERQELLDRHLGPSWARGDAAAWERVGEIPDDRLRDARRAARRRLLDRIACAVPGSTTLDPEALTIGFARRFATYKRAALLLLQGDRLARLLANDDRPVQLVFSGKAHPADEEGKAVLRAITAAAREPWSRGRLVFLPDYDMAGARLLVAGCDVWLNTPLRPLEASGTSGMKAALNGVLNCSIRDGWWDEMFDGANGWAIAASDLQDAAARDRAESAHLLDVLESQIVPLFYDGGTPGPSAAWFERVHYAWRTLGPEVTAARMLDDYVRTMYEPAVAP
jgi:starch phosphorylase